MRWIVYLTHRSKESSQSLIGEPDGKGSLGRPSRKQYDSIKRALKTSRLNVWSLDIFYLNRGQWRASVNKAKNLGFP
jgi:hypothetical protein